MQDMTGTEDLTELSAAEFQKLFGIVARNDLSSAELMMRGLFKSLILDDTIYHTIHMRSVPNGTAEGTFPKAGSQR